MKVINLREAFTWLKTAEGKRGSALESHTLKIEVYNAQTQDKVLTRYIHLNESKTSNLLKVLSSI